MTADLKKQIEDLVLLNLEARPNQTLWGATCLVCEQLGATYQALPPEARQEAIGFTRQCVELLLS